ncbi:helix-turn-helix domain-containing protein [Sphingomonas sp. IC4-52]|uniref:helix-turn-helix domain-containing protein n=1 Tax=Sphingomonas sp. IC4-52 TaxID=2887202 RepID=UPI001D12EB13|nr:helix-turn-helix transcriptional regulator [Sphingomonas sp. IC4-52]
MVASPILPPSRDDVHLTHRELQVLAGVCAGQSSKQIACDMGLRPHTVESYIGHMKMKLAAHNRCHMVAIAVARGICGDGDGRGC